MNVLFDRVWPAIRRRVPLWSYPLLFAAPYRLVRRVMLRRAAAADARYRREHPDAVVPPPHLRAKVISVDCSIERFLDGGRDVVRDLERALQAGGGSIDSVRRALDFGCGCGRVLLAARTAWPHVALFGSDVDPELAGWCREHLAGVETVVNSPMPPLPFADATFDLVWASSVFTHLDEQRQDAWLRELDRVVAPRGFLIASVQGESFRRRLPRREQERIETTGFLYARTDAEKGIHPDWYQVAWHTEAYVRRHWTAFFDVRAYLPLGLDGVQDLVVAAKR
jgi:SAM-dependent methyltransferase